MSECPHPEKIRHATEGAAWAAVHALRKKREAGPDVRPYRCGSHWHVGHDVVHLMRRFHSATAGIRGRGRRR